MKRPVAIHSLRRRASRWSLAASLAFRFGNYGFQAASEKWIRRITQEMLRLALELRPFQVPEQGETEIHMLVCERDALHALWSLHSICSFLPKPQPLVLHDDGSLLPNSKKILSEAFPGARWVEKKEADEAAERAFADFPNCLKWRSLSAFSFGRKLCDPLLMARSPQVMTLDSDIVFFKSPDELLGALEDPAIQLCYHNEEQSAYQSCTELCQRFPEMRLDLNSGMVLRRNRLPDFAELEAILEWLVIHHGRLRLRPGSDQLVISILAGKMQTKSLPKEYSNSPERLAEYGESLVSMHFHSWSRYLFALKGIPKLLRNLEKMES